MSFLIGCFDFYMFQGSSVGQPVSVLCCFLWLNKIQLYRWHYILFVHLGGFYCLTVNSAAEIPVQVFVWAVFISVQHIPRSGLAGSCNGSMFNVLRCWVGLQVSTVIYFLFSMRHYLIIRTLFKSSSFKALLGYSLLTQSWHQIQLEVAGFVFMTAQE